MLTRKHAAARPMVESRAGVAPHDVDALANCAVGASPFHCDSLSSIFAGEPECGVEPQGPNLLQANQANSGQCEVAIELGPEWRRQMSCEHGGIDPVIDEDAAANEAANGGQSHAMTPRLGGQ